MNENANNLNEEDDETILNDFYLTAFLLCGHATLKKIKVIDREKKKCGFVLIAKENLKPIIHDFFNDKVLVNPQQYKDKIISLKMLLHETKNQEGLNIEGEGKNNE